MNRNRNRMSLPYIEDAAHSAILWRQQRLIMRKYMCKNNNRPRKRPPPDTTQRQPVEPAVTGFKTVFTLSIPVLRALFSKRGILLMISLWLGKEAGRSTGSFCLAVLSFLGGGQKNSFLLIFAFLGGLYVGANQITAYIVLLSWLVAYACQVHVKDVVLMTLAYWFGILANVSGHVFFLVVFSYLGAKAVRYDKEFYVYVGLSFLLATRGEMSEVLPFPTGFVNFV